MPAGMRGPIPIPIIKPGIFFGSFLTGLFRTPESSYDFIGDGLTVITFIYKGLFGADTTYFFVSSFGFSEVFFFNKKSSS